MGLASKTTRWLPFLGTCLSLWLCLLATRRLLVEVTESSIRMMTAAMRATGQTPLVEVPQAPELELEPEAVPDEPLDGEALPPWASDLTEEEFRQGIDPKTGRPLTW